MGWSWFHSPWSWFFGWKTPAYHPPNRIHTQPESSKLPRLAAWRIGGMSSDVFFAYENGDYRNLSEIQSIKQKLPNLKFQRKKLRVLGEDCDENVRVYFSYQKTKICKILWNTALVPSKNWGKHVLPASQLSPASTCGSRSSKRSSSFQQSKMEDSIFGPQGFWKKTNRIFSTLPFVFKTQLLKKSHR